MAEVPDDDLQDDNYEEEKQNLQCPHYENLAIKAAAKGDIETLTHCYTKKPQSVSPNFKEILEKKQPNENKEQDKDPEQVEKRNEKQRQKTFWIDKQKGWTPIVWAASKNQFEVLKFLFEKGALQQYLEKNEEIFPSQCTLGKENDHVKPTPLQWACFQGNLQIVWFLLKRGCRWQDVDQFGNNCSHLAASGGNLKVFEALLMHGIDVEGKNARNHDVMDLSTNKDIISLIQIHRDTTKCAATGKNFEFGKIKHWCSTCRKIFSPEAYRVDWSYENNDSTEKERLDGKCLKCWENIANHTKELESIMLQKNYDTLTEKLNKIEEENIEIDAKTMHKAVQLQEQLRTQNVIKDTIASLQDIKNYKTIFKSAHQLKEIKEDADKRGVNLDQDVIDFMNKEVERLYKERQLRFDLDNMDIANCKPADKDELDQHINEAKASGVKDEFLDTANEMLDKMQKSIDASDIYNMFVEYKTLPEEDYPKCFYKDPKTGKAFDPVTKKPADSKSFPPPKKKKKRKGEPKLVIPDWCAEHPDQLKEKINVLKKLLESAEDCRFTEEFIKNCNAEIKRMEIEKKYRYALLEENNLIAEFKAAQKKKK